MATQHEVPVESTLAESTMELGIEILRRLSQEQIGLAPGKRGRNGVWLLVVTEENTKASINALETNLGHFER